MKRRILHELTLDKIAAVDVPCQEGATVAIIKSAAHQGLANTHTNFEKAVASIQTRDGCTRTAALEKVASEQPRLTESARAALPPESEEEDGDDLEQARDTFDRHVRKMMSEQGLSRRAALERAPGEHPEAFKAAYG
jgi:hypothetical protein